jgi:two-component system, NtrC family, response regulator AtoC
MDYGPGPVAQLCLLVSADEGLVRIPLPQVGTRRRLTFGRAARCDIPLNDASMSREHAALLIGQGSVPKLAVEDLRSANGTHVLGYKLDPRQKCPLPLGAVFDLASTTLLVHERRKLPQPKPLRPVRGPKPVAVDPHSQRIFALLDVLGPSSLDVLLVGETGTGKRTYAHALVARSSRAKKPLVTVDSGTLDLAQLSAAREEAGAGTLLFERVDELPRELHGKVLGPHRGGPRRLFTARAEGLRLASMMAGFSVALPPLRARRDDIVPLAEVFIERSAKQLQEKPPRLSEQAKNALTRHEWPRNARELEGVMDRAVLDADGAEWIDLEHLRLPRYE